MYCNQSGLNHYYYYYICLLLTVRYGTAFVVHYLVVFSLYTIFYVLIVSTHWVIASDVVIMPVGGIFEGRTVEKHSNVATM